MSKEFAKSIAAIARRLSRDAVRKGPFTKTERDIIIALVNHWFHHRGNGREFIHPGREKLSKRSQSSTRSVARCLSMLRDENVITPVANLHGGWGKATRYIFNFDALMALCGYEIPDVIKGSLVPLNGTQCGTVAEKIPRDILAHGNNNVRSHFHDDEIIQRPALRLIQGGVQ